MLFPIIIVINYIRNRIQSQRSYPDMLDYGNSAEYNIATIHLWRCCYVKNS